MKYWAPLPASSPVISTCRGMSNFGLYTENDNLILHTLLLHRIDVEIGTRVKKNILKLERVYFTEYKAVNISIKHSNEDNSTM